MPGAMETSRTKIVHFFSLFSTVLSGFPSPRYKTPDGPPTPRSLYNERINYLGVNHRVPLDLECTSSPPRTGLAINATSPEASRSLRDLRSLESHKLR